MTTLLVQGRERKKKEDGRLRENKGKGKAMRSQRDQVL
jgi:hypothetical protein